MEMNDIVPKNREMFEGAKIMAWLNEDIERSVPDFDVHGYREFVK
jgi:hypothetical protein